MNKKEFRKKYHCSIHGSNGHPECKECWEKLNKLAKDNNALVFGP